MAAAIAAGGRHQALKRIWSNLKPKNAAFYFTIRSGTEVEAASKIWISLIVMLVICTASFLIGDRSVKRAAGWIAICWSLIGLCQIFFHHTVEFSIAGDVIAALGFLALVFLEDRLWLWLVVALAAALLLTHAFTYQLSTSNIEIERFANNAIVSSILLTLIVAAILTRKKSGGMN